MHCSKRISRKPAISSPGDVTYALIKLMIYLRRAADPVTIAVINAAPRLDIVERVALTVDRVASQPTEVAGVS